MKIRKLSDFKKKQININKVSTVIGGQSASGGSTIDYGTYAGNGTWKNDTTKDAKLA